MSKTKILFSGLFLALITAGNAYSGSVHNVPGLLITPISNLSSSYQVAGTQFLPELKDSENGWAGNNINGITNKNDCSAYPLTTCPSNGKCTKCPVGDRWKLESCDTGYTLSGNSCTKKGEFCVEDATTFKASIPADYYCGDELNNPLCNSSTLHNCEKCYKSCYKVNCGSYPLDCKTIDKTALHITTTETCANCKLSLSNCLKTYCKITGCEDGYKINAAGTACIEKSDICPNGYYKSCETGTQGEPQYTEKGTACYQCKPKTTEYMKVVVNFARDCPAGLTFKMTPQGSSTVTCSSSNCYEYDSGNYPYAPDAMHSNETESVVVVGTKINLSDIPSAVSGIKSISQKQSYSVSGTTYSFNVNDKATVNAAYDFWTLQCGSSASDCSTTSSPSAPLGQCPTNYGLQINATTAGKVGCYPCLSCSTQKLEDRKISGSTCETKTFNQNPGLQGTCYKCGCPINTAATAADCPAGSTFGTSKAVTLADGTECFSCIFPQCSQGLYTEEGCKGIWLPNEAQETLVDGTICAKCQLCSELSGGTFVYQGEQCPSGTSKNGFTTGKCEQCVSGNAGASTCPTTCNSGYIKCASYTPGSNTELQTGTNCCFRYLGKNKCPSCTTDELCKLYNGGCAFAGYTKQSTSLKTSTSRGYCYEYSSNSEQCPGCANVDYYWEYSK